MDHSFKDLGPVKVSSIAPGIAAIYYQPDPRLLILEFKSSPTIRHIETGTDSR